MTTQVAAAWEDALPLAEAAAQGYSAPAAILALRLLRETERSGDKRFRCEAEYWLRISADRGNPVGNFMLGVLLRNQPNRIDGARRRLALAVQAGHVAARAETALLDESGLPQVRASGLRLQVDDERLYQVQVASITPCFAGASDVGCALTLAPRTAGGGVDVALARFVGAKQAVFQYNGRNFHIGDPGSRSGTYLNGTVLARGRSLVTLSSGDTVSVGRSGFVMNVALSRNPFYEDGCLGGPGINECFGTGLPGRYWAASLRQTVHGELACSWHILTEAIDLADLLQREDIRGKAWLLFYSGGYWLSAEVEDGVGLDGNAVAIRQARPLGQSGVISVEDIQARYTATEIRA